MSQPVIEVDRLSKLYRLGAIGATTLRDTWQRWWERGRTGPSSARLREFWALRDVSFSVQAGEIVGIIGRNGAGKSTLLKILSRITEPTSGRAVLRGRAASLLEVGTGFHPDLTGRENIFLNGAILGMTRREMKARFDEIVEFAEVAQFIDTPVKRYSSGMYVRLAFAVAAHLQSEVVIVDEVLAVGDAAFQKKCLGQMDKMAHSGRTVLFVSHNMVAVKALCQHAIMLKNGSIATTGSAEKCVSRYLQDQAVDAEDEPGAALAANPGEATVRLRRVRILAGSAETLHPPVDQPITVEVEFENRIPGRRQASVHLSAKTGEIIFTSGNIPSASLKTDRLAQEPMDVGVYVTACTIPPFFFNPGLHFARFIVYGGSPSKAEYFIDATQPFTVTETERFRTEYFGEWVGLVRPLLDWRTRKVD